MKRRDTKGGKNSWRTRAAALLTAAALGAGCAPATGENTGPSCTRGMSAACACSDGRMGAQVCDDTGGFGRCICGGRVPAGDDAGPPPQDASDPRDVPVTPDVVTPVGGGCSVSLSSQTSSFTDSCPVGQICRCPVNAVCTGDGECINPLPHGYYIHVLGAHIAPTRPNGTAWDGNNSRPDLAAVVFVDDTVVGLSPTAFDTTDTTSSPGMAWYTATGTLTAASTMRIALVDSDGDLAMGQFETAINCNVASVTPEFVRRRLFACEMNGSSIEVLLDAM